MKISETGWRPFGFLGSLVTLAWIGCGGPATSIVSGTVTFDGKPVTGGAVALFCENGQSFSGAIQSDGTYRVENVPVGEATVTVFPEPEADEAARHMDIKNVKGNAPLPPPPKPKFPTKYTEMSTSDLRCKVQAGATHFDVILVP